MDMTRREERRYKLELVGRDKGRKRRRRRRRKKNEGGREEHSEGEFSYCPEEKVRI